MDEKIGERIVIPEHSSILVETKNETEAYYLTGVLNSTVSKLLIAAYTYELRQETHILEHVRIPKFVRNEKTLRIAELARKASETAKKIEGEKQKSTEPDLLRLEEQIDLAVAEFYGIDTDQLEHIKSMFKVLSLESSETDNE